MRVFPHIVKCQPSHKTGRTAYIIYNALLCFICFVQNYTNKIQALMSLRIKTEHMLGDDVQLIEFTVLYMFRQSKMNERLHDVTPYRMSSDISASPRK
jgi:hypothetical protein